MTLQIISLFGFHPHLIRVEYRRVGQRGKVSKALIDTAQHPDPRAALAGVLGEKLSSFKIIPIEFDEKED